MSAQFKLDDSYVDVAARLTQFYEKFPDGRITRMDDPRVMEMGERLFVVYSALAYRTPDDPIPAVGTAWEPFPGTTPYTRDSELMNAETAAWGRAIVAAGIPSKKIASADEVAARAEGHGEPPSKSQLDYLKRILRGSARNIAQPTAQEIEELGFTPVPGWVEKLSKDDCKRLLNVLEKKAPPDIRDDGKDFKHPPPAKPDESDLPWTGSGSAEDFEPNTGQSSVSDVPLKEGT